MPIYSRTKNIHFSGQEVKNSHCKYTLKMLLLQIRSLKVMIKNLEYSFLLGRHPLDHTILENPSLTFLPSHLSDLLTRHPSHLCDQELDLLLQDLLSCIFSCSLYHFSSHRVDFLPVLCN